jgi:universal stress protein A
MGDRQSTLPAVPVAGLQLRRILVPVDFSDCSRKAVRYAAQLAAQFNAELMLLHVLVIVQPPATPMLLLENEGFAVEEVEAAAKALSEWRKDIAGGLRIKAVTRSGTAAHHEIVLAARECNSDLIVIGNHGRTGLGRVLLGSTAELVVRHAPCPVLVIREHEHDFLAD